MRAHYFLDSSGLVKRYVVEAGSGWGQSLRIPDAGNTIYISRITGAEVIAAIFRRLRMGDLRPEDAQTLHEAMDRIAHSEIRDAKTTMTLQHLACSRLGTLIKFSDYDPDHQFRG